MRRILIPVLLLLLTFLAFSGPIPVRAQSEPPANPSPELTLITSYPSQMIGIGETVTLSLRLRAASTPQVVRLEVQNLPEGWNASFRGGGRVVQSVYVEPDNEATVDLRVEPPATLEAGTYHFTVIAQSDKAKAQLPIELTVKEKLPPRLTFDTDLPTLRGTPSTTFRFNTTLKNEGDEELNVNLTAEASSDFLVKFKLSGQEVTSIPLGAKESKSLSIEAQPLSEIPAGSYPITIRAEGGEVSASLELVAEVTGQPDLSITTPDGRLSGQANAGRESPIKLVIRNTGSAPARGVTLSASEPSGWTVEFDPKEIPAIAAGEQVEITAKVRPSDKAVAGDYMLTINARPAEGASESAEFRITVTTSTLWGVVGVALIAVAVGVVAMAVMRFGRR
jgi:uncharacterized membrane protein